MLRFSAFSIRFVLALQVCASVLAVGCYSFKGISIDPNIKTFFVRNFEVTAVNAPPTLAVDFTERLKDKVRTETPLKLNSDAPDAEFTGRITDFRVIPVAPKPGETVSLNRLEIRMQINYVVNLERKEGGWPTERTFSHFAEFGADQDLISVQNNLIRQISDQLLEDIFNAAFNNW